MRYLAIVAFDENDRVAKFAEFDSQEAADDHVARFGGVVVADAGDQVLDLRRGGDGRVAAEPRAAEKRIPGPLEVLERALVTKGVLTAGDIEAAKTALRNA